MAAIRCDPHSVRGKLVQIRPIASGGFCVAEIGLYAWGSRVST